MKNDKNREFVRTLHSMIADYLRDNPDIDRSYYQEIWDWLEKKEGEENEDERILASIADCVGLMGEDGGVFSNHNVTKACVLSYLEKQKDQKPAEWSEEDSERYISIGTVLEVSTLLSKEEYDADMTWLRELVNAKKFSGQRAKQEWSEDGKKSFVDSGFLWCVSSFEDFKAGETYWLEYLSNDNYSVRSDNLLARTYHITPEQLYSHFKKYIVQKRYVPYEPQNWPADQDNLTQDQKQEWSEEKETAVDNFADEFVKWVDAHPDWDKDVMRATALHFFKLRQKWSEEEEKTISFVIDVLRANHPDGFFKTSSAGDIHVTSITTEELIKKLKSLLSRPKPSGNWKPTKDDKRILKGIIGFIGHDQHYGVSNEEMVDWLKKTFSEFA